MTQNNRQKLLGYGLDTNLIDRIEAHDLPLSEIKDATQKKWRKLGFTPEEAKFIYDQVTRKPIAAEVVVAVVSKAGQCCCYCADGNSARPYQLHHIEEHHVSRNDTEENLLLICPTHHVWIHATAVAIATQQEKKQEWESLSVLAKVYGEQGFAFPYGNFAPLLYPEAYDITQVFQLGTPPNSVCQAVTTGSFAEEALAQLTQHHRLLLSGESGSGKSTFAVGVAGHLAAQGVQVFKYLGGGSDGQAVVRAIVEFALVAQHPVLLLVDDANRLLNPAQIEQVLQAATSLVKIAVVVTRNQYVSEGNVEQHFSRDAQHIDWLAVQPMVRTALLAHQQAVTAYMRQHASSESPMQHVGNSQMDTPLERFINAYGRDAQTAWQFMYMLGGGLQQVEKVQRELRGKDRFDLVVLRIALTQLSEFEKATSLSELLTFYQTNPLLQHAGAPEPDWLRSQLIELVHARRLLTERGRFKTVHREFARAFLEAAYRDPNTRPEVVQLLKPLFDFPAAHIKQIVVLWSWFKSNDLNDYLYSWRQRMTSDDWKEMVKSASAAGLETVAFLADHLHMLRLGPDSSLIADAFGAATPNMIATAQQSKPGENACYLLNKLCAVLKTHCPATFIALLDGLGTQFFVELITAATPGEIEYLSWLFSAAEEVHPDWVAAFQGTVTAEDMQRIASRAELGNLDGVFDLIGFQRRYLLELTKSQFDSYINRLAALLNNCPLSQLHYPIAGEALIPELMFSPVRIQQLTAALDLPRLAREYEMALPRHWGNLLPLTMLENWVGLSALRSWADMLSADALAENIAKYQYDVHALRLMLYQLCHGTSSKRVEFANRLRPLVEDALRKQTGTYEDNVLRAFTKLDSEQGEQVRLALGLAYPVPHNENNLSFAEGIEHFARLDSTGEDYAMPLK